VRIAFAYIDVLPDLAPMYRACAEGLANNVWDVFELKPLHITNDKTTPIKGCDVLRVDIDERPMTWRLLAHQYAHALDDEILFTEPDVRFRENILHCFQKEFDVAFTDREEETIYGGEKTTEVAPYTQGSTFSRSAEFWADCVEYCKTLPHKKQLWFGDMLAVAHVVKSDKYNVGIFPASKLNHIPKSKEDTNHPVVHYKGKRKAWLFPNG
jgi:hypothetical protein